MNRKIAGFVIREEPIDFCRKCGARIEPSKLETAKH
jgi:hypothetical protein